MSQEQPDSMTPSFTCPLPLAGAKEVQIGHGGGGRMTQQLIDTVFAGAFANPALDARHDGGEFETGGQRLALSTDSHVVSPLFFPGGDIGRLAIHGTVNDLAMCGARARWITAGFILEEGLSLDILSSVVRSMAAAARESGVQLVAGDTKVVEKGRGDGVYINTAGLGVVEARGSLRPASVRAGDAVLVSGDLGRHGMAIMAQREGLAFESPIESDCANLWPAVQALLGAGLELHCLRDLTRGGLAAAVIEIAETAGLGIRLAEDRIAVSEPVRGACELLGMDPLHVANEGRFVAILPKDEAGRALEILRVHAPGGDTACIAGVVHNGRAGEVTLTNQIGVERILDRPSGEQLPRIC